MFKKIESWIKKYCLFAYAWPPVGCKSPLPSFVRGKDFIDGKEIKENKMGLIEELRDMLDIKSKEFTNRCPDNAFESNAYLRGVMDVKDRIKAILDKYPHTVCLDFQRSKSDKKSKYLRFSTNEYKNVLWDVYEYGSYCDWYAELPSELPWVKEEEIKLGDKVIYSKNGNEAEVIAISKGLGKSIWYALRFDCDGCIGGSTSEFIKKI